MEGAGGFFSKNRAAQSLFLNDGAHVQTTSLNTGLTSNDQRLKISRRYRSRIYSMR